MKKMLIILSVVLSLALAGNVMADFDSYYGTGGFGINASSIGGAYDLEGNHYPNGGAFGISGAGGIAKAEASGFIFNGSVEGEVSTIAGGVTNTFNELKIESIENGKKLTLGSYGFGVDKNQNIIPNQAVTGGSVKVKVDPEGKLIFGFIPTAGGEAHGSLFGVAGQGSLNATYLTDGPMLNNDGFTGGIAGQASVGMIQGCVFAISGPDYYYWDRVRCRWIKVNVDSKAGALIDAEISMNGFSYSESYRLFTEADGVRTESMGTFVGAETNVTSFGRVFDRDNGLGYSNASLNGGWVAGGGAISHTKIGGANATAIGFYKGSGALGNGYQGAAVGGTYGSVTTVNGMKGSIVQSGASMSVTSNVTGSMHGDIN